MNDQQRIFDFVFKSKGGIFDTSYGLDKPVVEHLNSIKNLANSAVYFLKHRYPTLPEVHIDYIDNLSLNACASKFQGEYYLGINLGTYLLVQEMFQKMFATKTVLPHIGDADSETDEKKVLNAIKHNGSISYSFNIANQNIPKDEVRRKYAATFSSFVLNFLILHELGHIVRGHCGFVFNTLNTGSFNELEFNNKFNIEPSISQTLEMDADSFATNNSYILFEIHTKKGFHILGTHHVYHDIREILKLWVFAVYSFFRLCGLESFNPRTAKNMSHPPASVRINMIRGNLFDILNHRKVDNLSPDSSTMSDYAISAEQAFSCITYDDISLDVFLNHDLSKSYTSDILNNWNIVRPLIEPYAFGELPPLV